MDRRTSGSAVPVPPRGRVAGSRHLPGELSRARGDLQSPASLRLVRAEPSGRGSRSPDPRTVWNPIYSAQIASAREGSQPRDAASRRSPRAPSAAGTGRGRGGRDCARWDPGRAEEPTVAAEPRFRAAGCEGRASAAPFVRGWHPRSFLPGPRGEQTSLDLRIQRSMNYSSPEPGQEEEKAPRGVKGSGEPGTALPAARPPAMRSAPRHREEILRRRRAALIPRIAPHSAAAPSRPGGRIRGETLRAGGRGSPRAAPASGPAAPHGPRIVGAHRAAPLQRHVLPEQEMELVQEPHGRAGPTAGTAPLRSARRRASATSHRHTRRGPPPLSAAGSARLGGAGSRRPSPPSPARPCAAPPPTCGCRPLKAPPGLRCGGRGARGRVAR